MSAPDVAVFIIMGLGAAFWLWIVPVVLTSLIAMGSCRGFFGPPVIVWRGVEDPGAVADLVMQTAAGSTEASGDEENEADALRKTR